MTTDNQDVAATIINFPAATTQAPTLISMTLTLQQVYLRDLSWREQYFLFRVAHALIAGADADDQWAGEQVERVAVIWRRVTGDVGHNPALPRRKKWHTHIQATFRF